MSGARAEVTRTFVDTNVLVYAVDRADAAKQARALEILEADGAERLVISTQVLCELYVVVTRKLAQPLDEEEAAGRVGDLAKLPTVATDTKLVETAIARSRESRISFWDALIVAAAETAGCGRLLSEDLSHGSTLGSVTVENPFLVSPEAES